jgi:uncharacterized protein (DUF983 family)
MAWTSDTHARGERSLKTAVLRGLRCRCPNCGEGKLFARFTRTVPACEVCGTDFTHQRADDAPPYIVVFVVGHLIVGLALWAEKAYQPSLWLHMALWLPLTLALSILMLPPAKGAVIGLQWANRMHGFDDRPPA